MGSPARQRAWLTIDRLKFDRLQAPAGMPCDCILEPIITPKQFAMCDKRRRTKDLESTGFLGGFGIRFTDRVGARQRNDTCGVLPCRSHPASIPFWNQR